MDSKTSLASLTLVALWRDTLSDKERQLHDLAAVMLKKSLKPADPIASKESLDNGSYYPDKCHAFRAWKKQQQK
jgi:hypothetical protein